MQFLLLNPSSFFTSSTTLLLFSSFLFPLLCITQALIPLPPDESIPAVIMFGDSIVDTGNNNNIKTIAKVNFPPYGRDFLGGKPTGRFSNGKVPPDFFVEELGIKELLPAYLDPNLETEDLATGVNFASGGAGYDPLTSELASVISLSDQLEMFKEYIVKLERVVGKDRSSYIIANSLHLVVAGSNDITNTYYLTPFRNSQYDFPSYADLMVGYASDFMQLYRLGARRIGVLGVPPIGCLPSQRTLLGGVKRECVAKYNEAADVFNTKLSDELSSLNTQLPDSRMIYIDIDNLLLDLIQNPTTFGFEIADIGCCGTGTIEVAFLCSMPCTDVSKYVFWDSFHPTEKAYGVIVRQVLNKYINNFFEL
ncbi:GDSL esterase/lipase EXL3-like isoform X2 [Cornus florida]|uniref:GDSL esterase/lipase EXL3-like isoform X2 n=1 Tax=Cornus florida TaxID=4283 RepID=UPI00289D4FE8|nr:GDSL esterase/lipase EXL3-like isoform X2 [Cornus florida]